MSPLIRMLTKRQKDVLDFVRGYMAKKEIAPSLEEVQKHFKFASVSTAHYHIEKLKGAGYLEREAGQARAMSIPAFDFSMSLSGTLSGFEFISVPLVGSANCGPAELLAEENIEGYLTVKRALLPRASGIFALRASGNSLNRANVKGKNIEDGDIVLVDAEDRDIKDGDYVLSIISGAANLKKYSFDKKKNQIILSSESSETFKPIIIMQGDDYAVNGKVVGVMKRG
jgi:SOS regulatory protein LexA